MHRDRTGRDPLLAWAAAAASRKWNQTLAPAPAGHRAPRKTFPGAAPGVTLRRLCPAAGPRVHGQLTSVRSWLQCLPAPPASPGRRTKRISIAFREGLPFRRGGVALGGDYRLKERLLYRGRCHRLKNHCGRPERTQCPVPDSRARGVRFQHRQHNIVQTAASHGASHGHSADEASPGPPGPAGLSSPAEGPGVPGAAFKTM